MKRLLFTLGIIIISLEIVLYTYWYKALDPMEFFTTLGLCHLANSAVLLGLLTEVLPKDKRKLRNNIVLGITMTFFLILYFNASRIRNRIDKDGILTHGIIIMKKYGAKTSPYVITKFNYKGANYKSTLSIPDSRIFKKINLGDSVVITFVKEYPKAMNRTISLLNESNNI